VKDPALRSYKSIERSDLRRLLDLARADREEYFAQYPDWAVLYRDRVLCAALCQGAALHYMHRDVGINDFDVYTFYATHPDRPWYAKRRKEVDFGDPKFDVSEVTRPEFVGRRVDLMGRGLSVPAGADPVHAVQAYLLTGKNRTTRELAAKAVVLLEPVELLGVVVWPTQTEGV
jgi:hypothetical protein